MTTSASMFRNFTSASLSLCAATLLLVLAGPVLAASATDTDDCHQPQNNQLRIASCTRLIEAPNGSPKMRSWALNSRGIAWKATGDAARALADYSEAIRVDPANADAYFNRGNAAHDRGEFDRAVADFNDALRIRPNWAAAFYSRARPLVAKGDYDRAIEDFGEAIRLEPTYPHAFEARADAWERKGKHDLAIADYNEAIRIDPSSVAAYNGRGNVWELKHEHDQAIADYSQAIGLKPTFANPYCGRGYVWANKNDLARAMTDFNEAIRLDPKLAEAYNGRANIWWKRGEPDRALIDIDEAILLQPKNTLYYITRATALLEKLDFQKALVSYNEAIRLNPDNAVAFNNRGYLQIQMGELDRAMVDFTESIRLDPNYSKPYANRGQVWRLKGDLGRALADQDQAVRLRPDEALGYNSRGDTLRYRGQFDRALADYDTALRFGQGDVPSLTGKGLTYEKMGEFARAQVEFQKAVDSTSPFKSDVNRQALETARARLAALKSGAVQPIIPAAPSKAASANSVPTPAVSVPAAASDAKNQGRRVALVIGNSAYQNAPTLANPQHDARAIAATLQAVGFETTLISDGSHDQIVDALRAFTIQAASSDWAVVYYSGHGMEMNGVNYLIPVEARLATYRDIQSETVPLDQVLGAAYGAKKLRLVLVDACRNNPFAPQVREAPAEVVATARPVATGASTTRSVGQGMAEVKVSGATLVVFAAKNGQTALDGDGANSPFAVALTQRIATPNVEINKLFRLVRDDVMEATAGRQEPYTYGSLPGNEDFFFVAK
jgi:tetratricopeptide (TPR) repeat protein